MISGMGNFLSLFFTLGLEIGLGLKFLGHTQAHLMVLIKKKKNRRPKMSNQKTTEVSFHFTIFNIQRIQFILVVRSKL